MPYKKKESQEGRLEYIKELMDDDKEKEKKEYEYWTDFVKPLAEKGYCHSKSTINIDVKALGYSIVNKKYVMKEKDKVAVIDPKKILTNLIKSNKSIFKLTVKSNQNDKIKSKFIIVESGFENIISELLYKIYKDQIIGIIPGIGFVIIYAEEKRLNNILTDIKEMINKRVKKNI